MINGKSLDDFLNFELKRFEEEDAPARQDLLQNITDLSNAVSMDPPQSNSTLKLEPQFTIRQYPPNSIVSLMALQAKDNELYGYDSSDEERLIKISKVLESKVENL